jgi:predicted permease
VFARVRAFLRVLLRGERVDTDLDEEMSFHLDRLTEDLVRSGLPPAEARREARLRFGSVERAKARTREERGLAVFDEARRNLRFALRGMARSPLFATTSLLTLALCIGLGAAVFTVVDSVLWKPLPYPSPDGLAQATLYDPAYGSFPGNTSLTGSSWERIRDDGHPFGRAVYSEWVTGVNLTTDQAAVFVRQQRVGAGYFRTLGVPPRLGREFAPEEDVPEGPALAILSDRLWTRSFGADPDIVGRTLRLKGEVHTVVGVLPPDFRSEAAADVWTPLRPSTRGEGGGDNYHVLVRIPQDMSLEEADASFASIAPSEATRRDNPNRRFGLIPLQESLTASTRPALLVLLTAIALMLTVGSANLAGLQVARTLARRSEMATRRALGGGAGALTRQAVTENLLLGVLGGIGGMVVAAATLGGLGATMASRFSFWRDVGPSGTTVAAVLGLTAATTLLFGLTPVLQVRKPGASRLPVSGARGEVGGGGHVLRRLLLVGEVAMVTVLLFAAGLLVRSYGHLQGLDPGFDPEGLLAVQYSLDDARYWDEGSVTHLFDETLAGIEAIPGVSSAAVALTLPYERPLNLSFRLPGEDADTYHMINAVYVTPAFFETMGIPLRRGRTFDEGDREGTPIVAVANEALVARDFPGATALGAGLTMGFGRGGEVRVVGVVGNVQQVAGWGDDAQPVWETPTLYLPAAQASAGFFRGIHVWFAPSWIVRGDGADLAAQVTRVFREIDPDLPVARVSSLRDVMEEAFVMPRFVAAFLVVVAVFALLLAGVGLYGMVAHEVLQRRTEMGLRMALGATPATAVWTAASGGLRLTVGGLLVGGVLSVAAARILVHMIWGVRPWDPVTLAAIVVALAALAAVASFVPAVRVGRFDPARILREG